MYINLNEKLINYEKSNQSINLGELLTLME